MIRVCDIVVTQRLRTALIRVHMPISSRVYKYVCPRAADRAAEQIALDYNVYI